jgi:hypothetical protein
MAFPFRTAPPTASHRALALLLLEGALQLLTTNWDTCIERAAAPERINTIVTAAERLHVHADSLLKVHGCAERQDSLLVTTAQLDTPPVWTATAIAAGLAQATVVFLGIGDIASYVQRGLNQIVAELGPMDHVAVVSPSIETRWDASNWASLLPSLTEDRRWSFTGAEFAHGLLAAWVNAALSQVRASAATMAIPALPAAFDRLHATLRSHDADRVLSWLRRSHFAPVPGTSVARAGRTEEILLALALHTEASPLAEVPVQGPVRVPSGPLDLLIAGDHTSGVAAADEAIRRADQYRQSGLLGPAERLTVICAGHMGPLQATATSALPSDVIDNADDSIVAGAAVELVATPAIFEGTAA